MPTLTIYQQLQLSIVLSNLRTTIVKLREVAETADPTDKARFRNAAIKLENLCDELGLPL